MASVSTQKSTGRRRVIFRTTDGRRVALHVGRIPRSTAREIGFHLDHLVICRQSGCVVRTSTQEWVERIRLDWPRLSRRLAGLGLITDSVRTDPVFVDFVRSLISSRTDVKPNTIRVWQQTAEKIHQFFGERRLRSLTRKDGNDFLRWLSSPVERGGAGHQASTAGKRLACAKGFLNEAVDAEILAVNPFLKVKTPRAIDHRRRQFITAQTVDQLIGQISHVELRAVVALSRWGGLRTPSEPFALQWHQVDWHRQRIVVPAVKTRLREIPLFPELVLPLRALQSVQGESAGEEFLFPELRRHTGANLRKQVARQIRRAGLAVWPKIFQNMRSSRQTELEERFPRKTVCEWMGNSEQIADQHYLQVRQEHYELAVRIETTDGPSPGIIRGI